MNIVQTRIIVLPDVRVARADAAIFLGKSPKTMAEWKRLGLGPMPRKVGGRVYYYIRDLEAFVANGAREAI